MGGEIIGLAHQRAIGPGEQQVITDQAVQGRDVCVELRQSQVALKALEISIGHDGTSTGQRVGPSQSGKSRKIAIGRTQLGVVFNGQGCKMCVGGQVARRTCGDEQ